ncbi:MAG TPA: hypothetical protein VES65_11125 [Solirubrobacteraceae bacterium]|nr:hypothetical protein [Solirubrobacteraceae bacterium]
MASPALAIKTPRRSRARLDVAPWALAVAVVAPLALAYLLLQPPAGDLAAATYRSDLFARAGLQLRDDGWYAVHGHYLPGYSMLSPALGALLGVYAVLSLSALAAAALFGLIAQRVFGGAAARVAAGWFALGFGVGLLSGRVPYDLGFAIGLGSVLALMAGRTGVALVLAVLTSLASPVAGAFLALAGLALASTALGGPADAPAAGGSGADDGDRRPRAAPGEGLALAAAALAPIAVLALAFPEGGWEPFAPSVFWPALAGVLLIALLLPPGSLTPRARHVVRAGAALYALALIGSFALHTPVGSNSARLGALLAGPLLAGVLWDRHRLILCLLLPVLLYWQIETPINDEIALAGDPSVHAAYYAPLRAQLRGLTHGGRTIVEVPLTGSHWEAANLAGHDGIALARGWERQLDTRYASLFYGPRLRPSAYQAWLRANRVAYVALPDVRLDEAGREEGALIAHGLPYLHEVWRSSHWRLYALAAPLGPTSRYLPSTHHLP